MMLTPDTIEIIQRKVSDSLLEILPYITEDICFKVTLSVDVDDTILEDLSGVPEDENTYKSIPSSDDIPTLGPSSAIDENQSTKSEDTNSSILLALTQNHLNLLKMDKVGKDFFKRSISIPRFKNQEIELHTGQSLDDLRGQFCKIVVDNQVYDGHLNTNTTITGYSCSVMVQWSKYSPLDLKIMELLKDQYEFIQTHKDFKKYSGSYLPKNLDVYFALYAIPDTKAYKLEFIRS